MGDERRFGAEETDILRISQSLRNADFRIGAITGSLAEERKQDGLSGGGGSECIGDPQPLAAKDEIVEEVAEAIRQQTALGEMFAQATHQIGQLEEKVEHLRAQLHKARQLLADRGRERDGLKTEVEELHRQLEQARSRIARMENRSCWSCWFDDKTG